MSYALAEKRCENYGTCSGTNILHNAGHVEGDGGIANVNLELLKLYNRGADLLTLGQCDAVANVVREMEVQMTIPNIQGLLRYAYKEVGPPPPHSHTPTLAHAAPPHRRATRATAKSTRSMTLAIP